MSKNTLNFTKTAISQLSKPEKGKRAYYKDSNIGGLSLLVTSNGAMSFYLIKKIKHKTEFIFIGKFPDLSVDNARTKAKILLAEIATGGNPNQDVRKIRNEMTFGELFLEYMERHSKPNKKSWKYDQIEVTKFLSDWFKLKISDITRNDVLRRLEKIRGTNGLFQSNHMLERIRAIYNKAIEWGWEGRNPAVGIKKYTQYSRDRFAQSHEMPHLLMAIENDQNPTARDFFLMLLLTGVRKTNMMMMRWDQIIWEQRLWRIPETKNGEPQFVTLSERAIEILQAREAVSESVWVFHQELDHTKHYSDCRRAWERTRAKATLYYWRTKIKLNAVMDMFDKPFKSPKEVVQEITAYAKKNGIPLSGTLNDIRIHDLRRTFGSYQAIAGTSLQVIGKSLGHKSLQSTQVYARLNLDPIRQSVDKATELMFA